MADFIMFDQGAQEILDNGLPANVYFLLSTRGVSAGTAHAETDTLSGGVGEITGTGYARQTQATPGASGETVSFAAEAWDTGANTNWPASVRSVVVVSTADSSGVAFGAWNLQTGGTPRDLSAANTTETVTVTLVLNNPA